MKILVDHNIEGQSLILWGTFVAEGWSELVTIELTTFTDAGLPFDTDDRSVWRFAQANDMILLMNCVRFEKLSGNRSDIHSVTDFTLSCYIGYGMYIKNESDISLRDAESIKYPIPRK